MDSAQRGAGPREAHVDAGDHTRKEARTRTATAHPRVHVRVNRYAPDLVECVVVTDREASGVVFACRGGRTLMSVRCVQTAKGSPVHLTRSATGIWTAEGTRQREHAQSIWGGGA